MLGFTCQWLLDGLRWVMADHVLTGPAEPGIHEYSRRCQVVPWHDHCTWHLMFDEYFLPPGGPGRAIAPLRRVNPASLPMVQAFENLGLLGDHGGYDHIDANVRRRRECGAYRQLLRHDLLNLASWVDFQLEELNIRCTWTTMLRFNRNVPDLNDLSIVSCFTADSQYRHLMQCRPSRQEELAALTKVAEVYEIDCTGPKPELKPTHRGVGN